MPQVDLESLVCGGSSNDSKIAPETSLTAPEPDPDLPAESITLPITDETLDWLDINIVYDRDDSTKGTTNPKSHSTSTQYQNQKPLIPTNSQRYKAPIIGLPNKIQHSGYLGQSARRTQGRIFPQKGVKVSDPGSPKVSCFGRVLSERERGRRGVGEKGGCFFGCFGRREVVEVAAGRDFPAREREVVVAAVPRIGEMKRFVSGRRVAEWGGDVEEAEEGHVVWSGPLDQL